MDSPDLLKRRRLLRLQRLMGRRPDLAQPAREPAPAVNADRTDPDDPLAHEMPQDPGWTTPTLFNGCGGGAPLGKSSAERIDPRFRDEWGKPVGYTPTAIQRQAEDPAWAAQNPGLAAANRYRHPWQLQNSWPYRLGSWTRDTLVNPRGGFQNILQAGTVPAALTFLAGGSALGTGVGLASRLFGDPGRPKAPLWQTALAFGVPLSLLGGMMGYWHNNPAPAAPVGAGAR